MLRGLIIFIAVFSILCLSIPAFAEEPAEEKKEAETAPKEEEKGALSGFMDRYVHGTLEYKFFGQFFKVKQDKKQFLNELILKLDAKRNLGEKASLILKPVLRADNRHFTSGVIDKIKETDERRYYVNFKELYAVTRGESLDFHVGKKLYTWGKAEGYNPTDVINPHDYLDFPDREKIGVFSASVEYAIGDYALDAVYIPFFTPSRLPGDKNRWTGTSEDDISNITGVAGLPAGDIKPRELPVNNIGNSQLASRLRATLSGWDFALSYYHGFDSAPVVEERMVNLIRQFTPKFNEINSYGFSTATTFDKLEAHLEALYRDTANGRDDDFISYIAGGSYSWDELGVEAFEKVTLYFEYAAEKVTNRKDSASFYSSDAYTRPFKNAVLGSLNVKFNEDTEFGLGGNYNIDEYDHFIQPKLTHKFSDKLKLKTGLDILTGHKDTFWGKWRKNDRAFLNMTYYF